jgi:acyl-CoA dehydrogenase
MTDLWPAIADPLLVERLRAVVARDVAPHAAEIDRVDAYPLDVVRSLAREGFNAITVPKEYGGGGRSILDCVAVFEEVGYASGATATSLITIFQTAEVLNLFANETLKRRHLPRIAEGLVCSYAMTEAAHGSDVKHLDTKARRDGEGWVLDGEKSFVTSASKAELFVILAETEKGVTAFAVPRDTPGARTYESGSSATFGLRNGPHVNLELKNARIPLDHLVGEEGHGVRAAATTLDHSRVLAAAISIGIARAAVDGALTFARERVAFGKHVVEFQGIQWYLADLLAEIDAARLLTYDAAKHLDAGREIERTSSEAKLLASRVAVHAASQAVQICGAWGCIESAPFGRYLRDAKTYEIAGGSSEILRNTIGKFLQGTLASKPAAPPAAAIAEAAKG